MLLWLNGMSLILIKTVNFPEGGAGAQFCELIVRGLRAIGTKTVLVIPRQASVANNNRSVSRGRHKGAPFFFVRAASANLAMWKILSTLLKRKRHGRTDTVLFADRMFSSSAMFFLVCRMAGIPVFTWHVELPTAVQEAGSKSWKKKLRWIDRWLFEHWSTRLSKGLIVISRRLQQHFSKIIPIDRVLYSPIWIDPDESSPSPDASVEGSVPDDAKVVLYGGTYAEKDGIPYMLQAIALVKDQFPNLLFVMTGNPPKNVREQTLSEIRGMINRLDLNQQVKIVGFVARETLDALITRASVLMACRTSSRFANYGFPWKLGEYCLSGRPVVATRVSDLEDFFVDRESLFFAEPENAESIADALQEILQDEESAGRVADRSARIARKAFDYRTRSREVLTFISRWGEYD